MSFHQRIDMSQSVSLNSQKGYEVKIHDQWAAPWLGWFGKGGSF
jgi:hypothetical protein